LHVHLALAHPAILNDTIRKQAAAKALAALTRQAERIKHHTAGSADSQHKEQNNPGNSKAPAHWDFLFNHDGCVQDSSDAAMHELTSPTTPRPVSQEPKPAVPRHG
jgi:hypothetical protein